MFFSAIKSFFNGDSDTTIGLNSLNTKNLDESGIELEYYDPIEAIENEQELEEIYNEAKKPSTVREKLDIARDFISELNLTDAYIKLSSLLLELSHDLSLQNSRTRGYYSFSNPIEQMINSIINSKFNNSFMQIKWVTAQDVSYTEIFSLFISVLIELGKYNEAKNAIKEALRWNPVSFRLHMHCFELYFKLKDYKNAEKYALRALGLAISRSNLSECYLKLALIKKAMGETKLVSALYVHGSRFSNDTCKVKNANANGIVLISEKEAVEILNANGIQIEAAKIVQSALYKLMFKSKERNDKTNFLDYLRIVQSMLITKERLQKLSQIEIPW